MLASFLKRDLKNLIQRDASPNFQAQNGLLSLRSWWRSVRSLLGAQPFSALAPLRRKALVSVVCSRYENLPAAVLETMALGCPLVAARIGGIPEVLNDHTNGLLHRATDSEDLAAQIMTLLNDPERAAQLGKQAAIDCRQRFSPEIIAERTVSCYGKAIERRRSRK